MTPQKHILSLLLFFVIAPLNSDASLDDAGKELLKQALTVNLGSVDRKGTPRLFAQRLVRTRDLSLFMTKEEIERPITIAVIDSNFDTTAEAFSEVSWLRDSKDEENFSSHGSLVLSVILGRTDFSIAPSKNVSVLPISSEEKLPDLEKTFDEILDLNRKTSTESRIRIVNRSMGRRRDVDLLDKDLASLEAANSKDQFLLVNASGNDFWGVVPLARSPLVMAVGATGKFGRERDNYSNWGRGLTMAAATGVPFHLPLTGGLSTRTQDLKGTSFSTPVVSGALLIAQKVNPELEAQSLRLVVETTATDTSSQGYDLETGHGLPNIPLLAAVSRITKEVNFEKMSENEKKVFLKDAKERVILQTLNTDINEDSFFSASSAVEAEAALDKLFLQYFLSGAHHQAKQKLCKVFLNLEFEWGIKSFCSGPAILTAFDLDRFANFGFFASNIASAEFAEFYKQNSDEGYESFVKKYLFSNPERTRTFVENTWFNATFPNFFPNLINQWNNEFQSRPQLVILSHALQSKAAIEHPLYPLWYTQFINSILTAQNFADTEAFINPLFQSDAFISHPKAVDYLELFILTRQNLTPSVGSALTSEGFLARDDWGEAVIRLIKASQLGERGKMNTGYADDGVVLLMRDKSCYSHPQFPIVARFASSYFLRDLETHLLTNTIFAEQQPTTFKELVEMSLQAEDSVWLSARVLSQEHTQQFPEWENWVRATLRKALASGKSPKFEWESIQLGSFMILGNANISHHPSFQSLNDYANELDREFLADMSTAD